KPAAFYPWVWGKQEFSPHCRFEAKMRIGNLSAQIAFSQADNIEIIIVSKIFNMFSVPKILFSFFMLRENFLKKVAISMAFPSDSLSKTFCTLTLSRSAF
ncbi:MAG: hypothetical protein J1F28_11055, partial [Oscillospiraceae bacterium]|nr:hypothetical protein [Oscillospiraceae bacterium]